MLDMPNDFDVYLHDTPQKNLFGRADRAVSNGCIRVQEIFPLASLALTGDAEAGLPEIRDAIATGETQFLELSEPLPVYLLYWTAIAEPDGSVRFAPDPYGRDPELVEALQNRPGEPRRLQRVAAR
jgi:murein L,D-transpeptidase YcbB/YkuD